MSFHSSIYLSKEHTYVYVHSCILFGDPLIDLLPILFPPSSDGRHTHKIERNIAHIYFFSLVSFFRVHR